MAMLFTFGCGTLGELGTGRADDTRRTTAVAVVFPQSASQTPDGHATLEAVALGTDHSLAVVGGCVYRWGLLGANMEHRQRRDRPAHQPEVVPEPTSISELVPFASRDTVDEPNHDVSSPNGIICAVACGGSNSFMLTSQGELFMLGALKPLSRDTGCLRHIWGNPLRGVSSKVAKVAAGWRHCLLLTESGSVFAIGDDEHGQCAGASNGAVAVAIPSNQKAAGLAAGACHSVAWDDAGSAFAWGHGGSGRLGVGDTRNRRAPARVEMDQEQVSLASCGANFTLFVTSQGRSIWACGGNQYGQLGLGSENRAACEIPTRLSFPRDGEEVVSLQCGANHSLCLTRPMGQMHEQLVAWAWGCASSGQCGLGYGEQKNSAPPAFRAAPGALVDFCPPSPNWPLAVAAGRSHSAILAHIGRPDKVERAHISKSCDLVGVPGTVSPDVLAVGKVSRKLPEVPMHAEPTPQEIQVRRLPSAPQSLWTFPEGGSISHIHGMAGADNTSVSPPSRMPGADITSMSPLRLPLQLSPPPLQDRNDANGSVNNNDANASALLTEDDIIDMFCAGLETNQDQQVQSPVALPTLHPWNQTPQSLKGARQRSVSPMDVLVKLGEAALCGDLGMSQTTAVDTSQILQSSQLSASGTNTNFNTSAGSNVGRKVLTGVPQVSRKVTTQFSTPCIGSSWPRPPPSWSTVGKSRSTSQPRKPRQDNGRSHSPRATPRRNQNHARSTTPPPPHAWEAHPGPVLVGISTLSSMLESPNSAITLPQPPPPAMPHDQWTGVHDQLKGLSSMIANIGGSSEAHPNNVAGRGFTRVHGISQLSDSSNANVSGTAITTNGRPNVGDSHNGGWHAEESLLAAKPERMVHQNGSTKPCGPALSDDQQHTRVAVPPTRQQLVPSVQSPIHDFATADSPNKEVPPTQPLPKAPEPMQLGSPLECGSDTHLDFSPRSTGSTPQAHAQGRRNLASLDPPGMKLAPAATVAPKAMQLGSAPWVPERQASKEVAEPEVLVADESVISEMPDHQMPDVAAVCQAEDPEAAQVVIESPHDDSLLFPPLLLETDAASIPEERSTPYFIAQRSPSKTSITEDDTLALEMLQAPASGATPETSTVPEQFNDEVASTNSSSTDEHDEDESGSLHLPGTDDASRIPSPQVHTAAPPGKPDDAASSPSSSASGDNDEGSEESEDDGELDLPDGEESFVPHASTLSSDDKDDGWV